MRNISEIFFLYLQFDSNSKFVERCAKDGAMHEMFVKTLLLPVH